MRLTKMNQCRDYRTPLLHKILRNFAVGKKVHVVVSFGMASRIMVALEEKLSDQ
jgi:ribosomal protein L21E